MQTRVQKWGNSLGLRIPKLFARELNMEAGSAMDLSVANGQLVIRPLRRKKFELNALLAEISDGNLHAEISTGEPQGRESW